MLTNWGLHLLSREGNHPSRNGPFFDGRERAASIDDADDTKAGKCWEFLKDTLMGRLFL